MKFILRWYPYPCEHWRLLSQNAKGEWKCRQEFFDCEYVSMFFRNKLYKDRDNILKLEGRVIGYGEKKDTDIS